MKTSLSILFLLLGFASTNVLAQSDTTPVKQTEKEITLQIEGMACSFCARSLKNSLSKQLKGVTIHKIDPKKGFAKLSFEKGTIPSDDQLKKTVENAGFVLKKIERKREEQSSAETSDQ